MPIRGVLDESRACPRMGGVSGVIGRLLLYQLNPPDNEASPICTFMDVYGRVWTCMDVYVCMCVCVYVYMCICVYVCGRVDHVAQVIFQQEPQLSLYA